VCSIFKTIELKTITKTQDPTWDGVNLSIWSGAELYVGILIASLPPLRKAFDSFFKRVFPSIGQTSRSRTGPYANNTYGGGASGAHHVRMSTLNRDRKTMRSGHPGESVLDSDDESERAILDEEEVKSAWSGEGIKKTTKVTVVGEDMVKPGSSLSSH